MSSPVVVPLLNTNEPEARLAGLHVEEGQYVTQGDLLCTLETTKSTAEVQAQGDGYIAALSSAQGETVRAGDVLCYLADNPDWRPPEIAPETEADSQAEAQPVESPAGIRITRPALTLANDHDIDLRQFPVGALVTERAVRALIRKSRSDEISLPEKEYDPTAILIYGGGGHGKACLDLLRGLGGYRVIGFIDDGITAADEVMGVPLLGGGDKLGDLHDQGVHLAINAVGGIGDMAVRVEVFQRLAREGYVCPTIVHPTAFVEPSASLSAGGQIFPHAYVGTQVWVGYGCIVNTGAIVSHECALGDYVNVSPGAVLAGQVDVGAEVLIGMGVTVNLGVHIGSRARIGNSATVKADLPAGGLVRAGTIWPVD